jgi:hypothetical protein
MLRFRARSAAMSAIRKAARATLIVDAKFQAERAGVEI